MSQEAVERLLGRLITDERFRRLAVDSLEIASLQEGYCLSPAELQLLSGLELQRVRSLPMVLIPACAGPDSAMLLLVYLKLYIVRRDDFNTLESV